MAQLLVNGEQLFLDNNGDPLAGGKVYFYIPATTTPKDTWQDPDESITNSNPVILDSAGRAIIYGVGEYRQIVKDSNGNIIWDQLTSTAFRVDDGGVLWGEVSTGTANAQEITTTATFDSLTGKIVCFLAGFTNTTPMTLKVNDLDPIAIDKDLASGPAPLIGGEVVVSNLITCMWDEENNIFHLMAYPPNDITLRRVLLSRLAFANSISPTILAANTNNWNPANIATTSNIRVSASAAINITGVVAQTPGRLVFLDNVGSFPITLTVNDVLSSAGNRFLGLTDITINGNQSIIAKYDSTSAGWRLYAITSGSVLPLQGLVLNVTSDTDVTMTISRVPVINSDNVGITLFAVNVTGDISTSGVNGLDTGTVAPSSGYYIWLIYNPSTGTVAMLFSLSASSPTLPVGYTYSARLGWVPTDSSSDLIRLKQRGSIARYTRTATDGYPILTSGAAGSASVFVPVTVLGFLPSTAPIITVLAQTNADNFTAVAPNDNGTPFLGDSVCATFAAATPADLLLETSNIYYACGAEGGQLLALGWIDDIG